MSKEMTDEEKSFARIYEEGELPRRLAGKVRIISCLSSHEDQQVYLLEDGEGRRSILKEAEGGRIPFLQTEYANLNRHHFSFFPRVYECFEEDGREYLWREHIEGDTLYEIVERSGPYPEEEAKRLLLRLSRMTDQLHSCTPPLIHRDLKPQNIVLTPEENLFLIDMDTAREYREDGNYDTVFVATRQTAAPEQYGFRQSDCRTDVYALGVIYCYLLTGLMDVQKALEEEDMLSPAARKVIATCTRLDPEERYQNCAELENALLDETGESESEPDTPRKERKKGKYIAIAAVLLIIILVAGGRWMIYQQEEKEYLFSSDLIEEAVREQLGKGEDEIITKKDLLLVHRLCICGTYIMKEWDEHTQFDQHHYINSQEREEENGGISTLEDCAYMKNLNILILDRQAVSDISPLKGLPLVSVSLSDNPISDLTPLASCEDLEELHIGETYVEDLDWIENCENLQILDIGHTRVKEISPLLKLNLEELGMVDDQITDLEVLEQLPLKRLFLRSNSEETEERVGKIKTLEELTIYQYQSTTLEPLLGLNDLTLLDLSGGKVETLEGVENFPRLIRLILNDAPVSDLTPIQNCEKLRILTVRKTRAVEFEVLQDLHELDLVTCDPTQEQAIYQAVPEPWFTVTVLQ